MYEDYRISNLGKMGEQDMFSAYRNNSLQISLYEYLNAEDNISSSKLVLSFRPHIS